MEYKVLISQYFDKKCALKVTTLPQTEDPYMRKNVQRLASIMSTLNRLNVVSL